MPQPTEANPFPRLTASAMLESLTKSADAHAREHGDADYAIGDHIESLREALTLMTQAQREEFARRRAEEVGAWL